jgi:hypothetical protein
MARTGMEVSGGRPCAPNACISASDYLPFMGEPTPMQPTELLHGDDDGGLDGYEEILPDSDEGEEGEELDEDEEETDEAAEEELPSDDEDGLSDDGEEEECVEAAGQMIYTDGAAGASSMQQGPMQQATVSAGYFATPDQIATTSAVTAGKGAKNVQSASGSNWAWLDW